jgi:replicative DNA helicase
MSVHEPRRDLDAERGTLGGMLLGRDGVEAALEVVKGRDFYQPKHEQIFDATCHLYEQNQPVDMLTVKAELERRGELDRIGGVAYLHDLTQCAMSAANAGFYAETVHEMALLRRAQQAGTRITQMATETDGADALEILARIQSEVDALTPAAVDAEAVSNTDMLEQVLLGLEKPDAVGVQTGFADLDALTGGLQPGQMIIVAARPSIGKSTFDLDLHRHVSIRHGQHSLLFSIEMTHAEIMKKILSAEARVPFHHLRHDNTTDDDWKRIAKCMGRVAAAPLAIDDSPGLTLSDIRTRARQYARKHPLKLISVDYLQLITSSSRRENRQQEVAETSRGLKLLAKELEVPIVALAQLNRGPEQRADKKPQLSDLRESGSLEQDADIVILLHRESAYEAESVRAGEADLIVAKHRGGPQATITVAFQGHYSRFVDMAATREPRTWSPHDAAAGGVS